MANNKLLAIVTVLSLMATHGSAQQQDPSVEELLTIEKLLSDREWRALFVYLEANPQLTTGQSALAVELRAFVDDAKRGQLFGFDAPASASAPRNSFAQVSIY